MARRLRERAGAAARAGSIEAPADRLPFPDGSFDTVVATLVLCTVDDVPAALAEVARVLRPGGRLLFAEHVRSEDPGSPAGRTVSSGPGSSSATAATRNRDTVAAIAASPLELEPVERGELPKAPPIVRPLVVGSARKPA